jgi:hypothetical protein
MAERTLAVEFEGNLGAMRASSAEHEQVRQAATVEPEEPGFRLRLPRRPSASGDSRSNPLPTQPEVATDGRCGRTRSDAELEFEKAPAEHDRDADSLGGCHARTGTRGFDGSHRAGKTGIAAMAADHDPTRPTQFGPSGPSETSVAGEIGVQLRTTKTSYGQSCASFAQIVQIPLTTRPSMQSAALWREGAGLGRARYR